MKELQDAIENLFAGLQFSDVRPKGEKISENKIDFPPFIHSSVVKRVLRMYVEGATIVDIAGYFGMDEAEVNDLIDRYVA